MLLGTVYINPEYCSALPLSTCVHAIVAFNQCDSLYERVELKQAISCCSSLDLLALGTQTESQHACILCMLCLMHAIRLPPHVAHLLLRVFAHGGCQCFVLWMFEDHIVIALVHLFGPRQAAYQHLRSLA